MNRREFVSIGAVAVAGAVLNADDSIVKSSIKPLHPDVLFIQPLKITPKQLTGLSEKMILSHYNNNYGGAVKRAKLIEEKITLLDPNSNPFELGSLKREQMVAFNSMILHEYYFDNLGSSGQISTVLQKGLETSFGSVSAWESEFKKMALSLSGGSGWALLVYNERLKRLENVWSWDHMHGLWDSKIVIALDMYEHSYQMDFGANAKGYVDTFFSNLNWDIINQRII
ncbi:MAG TPA: Fe-Mn family superoxide dismutase [Sulfuricurvum sp.]|nr:Fe-Mn family superoxide dismutase [Sulfuricurvum sp.]